jgi:hypothetical protein
MARQLKSICPSADMNAAGRGVDLAGVTLSACLGSWLVRVLAHAGYDTVDKVRAASDEGLLLVNGIDEFALRQIREVVG